MSAREAYNDLVRRSTELINAHAVPGQTISIVPVGADGYIESLCRIIKRAPLTTIQKWALQEHDVPSDPINEKPSISFRAALLLKEWQEWLDIVARVAPIAKDDLLRRVESVRLMHDALEP